jgi:MoaA/NifB/PqqE/SkfB family radical SAM enzyme
MKLENFKKIIDQLVVVAVDLHGWGEPLLAKELYHMISYAYDKGILPSLATNGTLLDDHLPKIVTSPLYRVLFSIDTTDRTKIRNYQDFERLIENIKKLVNLKNSARRSLRIQCGITLMRDNLNDVPNVIRLMHEC